MVNLTNRGIGLLVIFLLLAATVSGQQTSDQKKKIPAMSSDDIDVAPSAKPAAVVSTAAGSATASSSRGLTRYWPEACGLSVELPAEPVSSESPLPGSNRQVPGSIKSYASVGDGYIILVCHVQMPGQPSLEGQIDEFLQGLFQGLSATPGHSNVKYTIADRSPSRASLRGSYDVKGGTVGLEGSVQLEGHHVWLVLAAYPQQSSAAIEPTRKVLASVKFDGPPCN